MLNYFNNKFFLLKQEKYKFTIIIPVYNCSKYLNKTIESVFNQTYNNYELYIIDDCSTDNSVEIILDLNKKYNFVLIQNEFNIGKFNSINKILKIINTDYFLILDADDKLDVKRLENDFEQILNNPFVLAIQSKYIRKFKNTNDIHTQPTYGENSITYSYKIIKKIGYYNQNRFGGDTEYISRFLHFLENKYLIKYDKITYYAIKRNNSLTSVYNDNYRKKFFSEFTNLHKTKSISYFLNDEYINHSNDDEINKHLDCDFYSKCYLDIINLNNDELKKHWKTIGIIEGRLPNLNLFNVKYPNFNYKIYLEKNIFGIKFKKKYEVYGWIYIENKNNYYNWLSNNNYIEKKDNIIDNNINNKYISFQKYIKNNNIKFICVSKSLIHFEERIINKFKLHKYNNKSDKYENTIFFGMYDKDDYNNICNHNGVCYLMWGGTDSNDNFSIRKQYITMIYNYLNIKHLAISDYIKNVLDKYNIYNQLIELNMVDENIFKPIDNNLLGKCIYIYNGYSKNNEHIYGKNIYDKIIKLLPYYKYIFSNELNVDWNLMPKIYKKCFIGLRLTNYDGNANTVQEFNRMNIPIIYNGKGGINWFGVEDIISNIKKYDLHKLYLIEGKFDTNIFNNLLFTSNEINNNTEINNTEINNTEIINDNIEILNNNNEINNTKINNTEINNTEINNNKEKKLNINIIEETKYIDFYNNDIEKEIKTKNEIITKNINNFLKLIENYKNILLICGDYPTYGGAATNCNNIQNFLIKNNFNTFAIYYNYYNEKNKKYTENEKYKIIDQEKLQEELKKLKFIPDIIILKNALLIDLKKIFNCPILFLIPGIFLNNLDKYYYDLLENEYDNYINKHTIKQIKKADFSFCNSYHTKEILKKKYNLDTYIFYSSLINYYEMEIIEDKNFNNRKYDYGIVVSNFNKKIKNITCMINFLSNKKNVILIY